MRVCLLSHSSELAGAELVLVEAARALEAMGHDIHVVLSGSGPLEQRLRSLGVDISFVPHTWWVTGDVLSSSLRVRRAIRFLKWSVNPTRNVLAVLRKQRPDVVVTNTLVFPQGALAARLASVPHVWYVHEFGTEFQFYLGERRSFNLIDRLSSRVVTCSRAVATHLEQHGVGAGKIHTVYSAVEVPHARAPRFKNGQAELRLLLLGKVDPFKGQQDAIRAVKLLSDTGLGVTLTIAGPDPNGHAVELRRLVERLKISDRVTFRGFTSEPYRLFADAHAVLMCSRSEAFGRVTVEAMKSGCPVIASDAGGNPELVRDGINGLLYRNGSVEDLAAKIRVVAEAPSLLTQMGTDAYEEAHRRFTLARYGRDLNDVLLKCADGRVTRPG
jgi:glycosyltransferase involved in cell wall biosynthesis